MDPQAQPQQGQGGGMAVVQNPQVQALMQAVKQRQMQQGGGQPQPGQGQPQPGQPQQGQPAQGGQGITPLDQQLGLSDPQSKMIVKQAMTRFLQGL